MIRRKNIHGGAKISGKMTPSKAVYQLAMQNKPVGVKAVQRLCGGVLLQEHELAALVQQVSRERAIRIIRGATDIQPARIKKFGQKLLLARAFIKNEALEKRPVGPTDIKRRFRVRTDVARRLFDLTVNDAAFLAELHADGVAIIRKKPLGIHAKKNL